MLNRIIYALISTKPKLSVMLKSGNGALLFHWAMRNTDASQELIEILLRWMENILLCYYSVEYG